MGDSVSRVRFTGRSIIAILSLTILGLLLLLAAVSLEHKESFLFQLLNHLSAALLIGGIWTGVYEWFMRLDFVRLNQEQAGEILNRIRLADGEEAVGLTEVVEDSNEYDYSPLLLEASELTIVLNDGRTWVSTHSEDLRQRFRDSSKRTTVFLLHPNSTMLEVMARKVDSTVDNLRAKIAETLKMLNELAPQGARIEIYGHHLFNPQSVFLGPSYAIVTLYFAARGRRTVPLLKFHDSGSQAFYRKLRDDLTDLRNDAEDISTYSHQRPAITKP